MIVNLWRDKSSENKESHFVHSGRVFTLCGKNTYGRGFQKIPLPTVEVKVCIHCKGLVNALDLCRLCHLPLLSYETGSHDNCIAMLSLGGNDA